MNEKNFNAWANERKRLGHDMRAVKGPPFPGQVYSDGTPVLRPVNVAWVDCVTGERFDLRPIPQNIRAEGKEGGAA